MGLLDDAQKAIKKQMEKLPSDMDSPTEIAIKLKDTANKHSDKLDAVKKAIPGDADDKLIDGLKKKLKK